MSRRRRTRPHLLLRRCRDRHRRRFLLCHRAPCAVTPAGKLAMAFVLTVEEAPRRSGTPIWLQGTLTTLATWPTTLALAMPAPTAQIAPTVASAMLHLRRQHSRLCLQRRPRCRQSCQAAQFATTHAMRAGLAMTHHCARASKMVTATTAARAPGPRSAPLGPIVRTAAPVTQPRSLPHQLQPLRPSNPAHRTRRWLLPSNSLQRNHYLRPERHLHPRVRLHPQRHRFLHPQRHRFLHPHRHRFHR